MFSVLDVEIPIGGEVHAVDGMCGRLVYVILDPIHERVTHLVVQEEEPPATQRLIPIELVHGLRHKEIELRCGLEAFRKLEPFVDSQFLPSSAHSDHHRLWPYVEPEAPMSLPDHAEIPAGEMAIRRGMPVRAADGPIGQVDELMIDRHDGSVTHLVLREGHLWGQTDISVPVSEIESIGEDAVDLKLSKKQVGKLPQIRIRRKFF